MSKTLEELEDEMYAARDVYDTTPADSDAEDAAWDAWGVARYAYNNKLMELADENT